MAVDNKGDLLSSARPEDSSGWHLVAIKASSPVVGISCPSSKLCVAVRSSAPRPGVSVRARYPNGDTLKVAFRNVESLEQLDRRFPIRTPRALQRRYEKLGRPPPTPWATHAGAVQMSGVTFPIATVEIAMEIAGTGLSLLPRRTAIGTNQLIGGWISNCGVGVQIGDPAGGPSGRERRVT